MTISIYSSLILGVGYSLYDYGGITAFSQILEAGVTTGFLLGSYYLAKTQPKGWLLLMLANSSMAALMFLQGELILSALQFISLYFCILGYKHALDDEQTNQQYATQST